MIIRFSRFSGGALSLLTFLSILLACDPQDNGGEGLLSLRFIRPQQTRSSATALLDTNEFILDLRQASGNSIYQGRYSGVPEQIPLPKGDYLVEVRSGDLFPSFESPVFGDGQTASVFPGRETMLDLSCRRLDSSVKLDVDSALPKKYPGGKLILRGECGQLEYALTENRTAYFPPGLLSVLFDSGGERLLLERQIEASEALLISVSQDLKVVCTSSKTDEDAPIWGVGEAGSSPETALSVTEAKLATGAKEIWVCGCIVGGDLTSGANGISFEGPFSSRTHMAIASRTSVSEKSSCLSVELKKTAIREAVNLVDNPSLLGCTIWLKGDLVEAYYAIPGLKNVKEYRVTRPQTDPQDNQ